MFTMYADLSMELINPWDVQNSEQAIAYGRSGNVGGNLGSQHGLYGQQNAGNEFAGAWLAAYYLISY